MQALLFVSMFGMFFAIVLGLMGSLSLNSMSIKDFQIAHTKQFMQDVASYFENDVVQRKVYIPRLSNPEDYMANYNVRQNVNWLWDDSSSGDLLDPWGTPFRIEAAVENHPITAGMVDGLNNSVQPQALGMVIASAGPDKTFSPALAHSLNALHASANPTINTVMNLEAGANSDDIVYTFNTRRGLERRWKMAEDALNGIAKTYARKFQQDQYISSFQDQVEAYYSYAYANGHIAGISGSLAAWKAPGAWYPASVNVNGVAAGRTPLLNAAPNFQDYASEIQGLNANDDERSRVLRDNGAVGGERNTAFQVVVQVDKTNSSYSVNDVLRLQLNPVGTSAWWNRSNAFRFRVEVGR